MLQIKNVCKQYKTGTLIQKALDDVSLNLRDNEFVAILGPSGSGKTTLLNIIGGLDRYDSGDLVINGISTKKYRDRDWDSYRNHTIGFVFQSYNLIPHQTVLANVELALTISGVSKAERRRKAMEALEKVGLGQQLHKKPNQMSGGQMQRVAIARALVNNPDIVLADEPTGALDSETSIQVMELLQEVAKDRLVVMVTHNPELAEEYATRIVNLKDGKILSDTNPFIVDEAAMEPPSHKNMGKSSMSLLTALSLSFNNLKTKKARTLLTSFAGSIGIIGIALILSLSTGVNEYIQSVEEDTLSEYPLAIQSTGFNMTSMLVSNEEGGGREDGDIHVVQLVTDMFSTMDSNDLASLKTYFDSGESGIEEYTKAVEYSYSTAPQIYRQDGEKIRQVHPDKSLAAVGLGSSTAANSMMSSMMSTDMFFEMPENKDLYESQYDVKAGRWPQNYNECVVVLTPGGSISDFMMYILGLRDALELDEMIKQFINEENINTPDDIGSFTYDDILGRTFKLVSSADYYEYDSQYKLWKDKTGDEAYMKQLVDDGEELTIVGIVQPSEDANAAALKAGIGYTTDLTKHSAELALDKEIVKNQLATPKKNVFSNEEFGEETKEEFDMDSLFTVDTDAISDAFKFDESALTNGFSNVDLSGAFDFSGISLDLSNLGNFDNISLELPQMPPINLTELLGKLNLSVTPEGISALAKSLLDGYQEYANQHPEADYSNLFEDFRNFLSTDETKAILTENIKAMISESGGVAVSTELLSAMSQELMNGYLAYVAANGYTDPEKFGEYFAQYLNTDEAINILMAYGQKIFENAAQNIEVTTEQMTKLADELVQAYQQYAQTNGLPDPSKMGEYFIAYLNTPEGQKTLSDGISAMIDMDYVENQLKGAVEQYVTSAFGSFTSSMATAMETQIQAAMGQLSAQIGNTMAASMQSVFVQMGQQIEKSMSDALSIDTDAFAKAFEMNMDQNELKELLMSFGMTENASYEGNLQKLGYVDFDNPSAIAIYPMNFEGKAEVVRILDDYNSRMEAEGKEDQVITYTDVVGTLMSSVTDIINIISYVLIAFVAISLVVSSIMIGVITYISVLERKKEIGILRAIGASKHNVSQVFNAETFIIGFCAGIIGIGLTLLALIPANALIHHLAGSNEVSAVLPPAAGVILIALSVVLTLIGGIIPSKKAAKSDPVTALRTE